MSQVTRVRFGLVETVERPLPATALYSRRPKVVIGSSCKRTPKLLRRGPRRSHAGRDARAEHLQAQPNALESLPSGTRGLTSTHN